MSCAHKAHGSSPGLFASKDAPEIIPRVTVIESRALKTNNNAPLVSPACSTQEIRPNRCCSNAITLLLKGKFYSPAFISLLSTGANEVNALERYLIFHAFRPIWTGRERLQARRGGGGAGSGVDINESKTESFFKLFPSPFQAAAPPPLLPQALLHPCAGPAEAKDYFREGRQVIL